MLNRWFGSKAHDFLHVLGMCVLAAGLPFNKVLMSIGAIWGVSNLILEGDYSSYVRRLRNNLPALLLLALFSLGLIGLIWSENLGYGLDDLRKKLPLLALPLALAAKPLPQKDLKIVLGVFVSSVFVISFINLTTYFFFNQGEELSNIRSMSKYVSHIRFSMMIVAAAISSWYLLRQFQKNRGLFIGLIIWFLVYTYLSQVLTGILAFTGVMYGSLVYYFGAKKWARLLLFAIPFVAFVAGCNLALNYSSSQLNMPDLLRFTAERNPYRHDTLNRMVENGSFVNINICDEELRREWNQVSKLDYDGFDEQGQLVSGTLYRYMTHLGLLKDALGFKKLDSNAIRNIELGYANPNGAKSGFMGRLADLRFQLENNHEPNGHSLLQRLEYWKTALRIIKKHYITGVGPGDVADAFHQQYELDESPLIAAYRLRAHNTYLTHWVSFGILGILFTLLFFYTYIRKMIVQQNWLPVLFAYLFLFSFFIEDTLETQAGVSLFSLLISLFLAQKGKDEQEIIS